jgi:hypothetical protein
VQLLSTLLRLLLTLSCFSRIPSHVILHKGIIVAGGCHLIRAFVNCSERRCNWLLLFFALALALVLRLLTPTTQRRLRHIILNETSGGTSGRVDRGGLPGLAYIHLGTQHFFQNFQNSRFLQPPIFNFFLCDTPPNYVKF